jgi:hypothetical protein
MLGGLRRVVNTAPAAAGGEFMRFGKDGRWEFGKEGKSVDFNDCAILNILSLKEGYVCWTDNDDVGKANEKLGELMRPVNQLVEKSELEDHGYEWARQQSIQLKFCDGAHTGTQTIYAPSSQGGLEILGFVIDLVLSRVEEGTPYFFPVVSFDSTHYAHKKWGKTYKPVLDIVGWADADGNEDPEFVAPEVAEPEPAPKPKPRQRAAAKPAAKPAVAKEEAAPAPRRRAAAKPVPEQDDDDEEVAPAPRRRAAAKPAPEPAENYEEPGEYEEHPEDLPTQPVTRRRR